MYKDPRLGKIENPTSFMAVPKSSHLTEYSGPGWEPESASDSSRAEKIVEKICNVLSETLKTPGFVSSPMSN